MAYIDQSDLLNATSGGLDIILTYYPQANDALSSSRKEFRIRDERTPSARLKQLNDGNWVVTDFGDDSVPRNGIQVCMKEDNLTYREALVKLADRYGVGGIKVEINKPEREKRDAKPEEKEKEYYFDIKGEIEERELAVLGPKVTSKVCDKYNVYSLKSYTYIKDRQAYTTYSNENYPIFMVEHDEFKKIYQPLNPEKQYRFLYAGNRPKDYINGLKQVRKAYEELQKGHDPESGTEVPKLPEIIIASGERDALNVAGFGFNVIWMNSETAKLPGKTYGEFMKMAKAVYNLPDIDSTGLRQAIKLGLEYLDIKTILLPRKLSTYRDNRGKPRKDFRDYIEIWPKDEDFKKLIRVAMPLRFWDEEITENGIRYHFNNEQAYFFLQANGYYQFENKNIKGGMMFIRIDGNIVSQAEPDDARKFMHNFMKDRYLPIPLRNTIHRSKQLSEGSLRGLEETQLDFTDYDKRSQYLFFNDRIWIVTGSGIEEKKAGEVEKYVWEEEVIDHKVRIKDPSFEISYDKDEEEFDIKALNTDSIFFRFLINSSRVHWRAELEERSQGAEEDEKYFNDHHFDIAGPRLTPDEAWEQKQHLINKIFSIGYLLHRYKDPGRPWCVFAMDNKNSETGESHGRSGKSFCYRTIRFFMKSVTLNGRNPKLTDNPHVYDRVTEHTDFVLIDDADQYLNFGFFFNALQGDLEVNPKNNQSYEIPFEHVPKFCITSNFTLRNIDPSTEGRILYSVFSDYYHVRCETESYKEDRTLRDDFGKNPFLDYTEEEWNDDFNFFARCLQFYLSAPKEIKLNPPMDNVNKRNLRTEMTEAFKNWADVFFDPEGAHCNTLVTKDDAFKDFKDKTSLHKWTTNKFTKALKAWAKYTEWVMELDPNQFKNSQGRIIRKKDGEVAEMIYVQTRAIDPSLLFNESTEDPFAVDPETKF